MKIFKKTLAFMLSLIMLLTCFSIMVSAETTEGIYTYVVADGEATITDFDYSDVVGEVVIPSTLGGYPVTAIDDYAFEGCYFVTSFVIPDSVRTTGEGAFANCTALKSITLGDGLTNFPFEVIEDSVLLEEINIGKSVRITSEDAIDFSSFWYSYQNLNNITVSSQNPYLDVVDGVLYGENMTLLLYYPLSSEATEYYMPDTVKGVFYPLSYANNLRKVVYNDKFSFCEDFEYDYEYANSVNDYSDCDFLYLIEVIEAFSLLVPSKAAEISVPDSHQYLSTENNVLYNKDKSVIIKYAPNRADNSFEIEPTVKITSLSFLAGARNINLTISDGFTDNINQFLL
ncbi:MAG: leucine-rich repeat domain-containing protein, partial [Ruminococcus sp.]